MPAPARPADSDLVRWGSLSTALRSAVDGDMRFDPGARHMYASDASAYRHVPLGVVWPRTIEALVAATSVCRDHGVPVTMRGAGTSLAGQASGSGIVVDTSRHLTRILEVDPEQRTATVEPGVVLADLQAAAAPHGLRFGPDPATANRCTIGGMLGNDSCGPHSLRHGRTSDNVTALSMALADGTRFTAEDLDLGAFRRRASEDDRVGRLFADLLAIRERGRPHVAALYPAWLPRLVSGIHVDRLCLPDRIDLPGLLVGTEGRCGVVLDATLRLVEAPSAVAMVLLGYPSSVAAADAVATLLTLAPDGLEGFDADIAAGARRRGDPRGLALLPEGGAWLVVEMAGATPEFAEIAARHLADAAGVPARVVTSPAEMAAVWEVRAEGLGAGAYLPDGAATHPGWEDAAVPPHRLGDYLRGLEDLLGQYGYRTAVYGHFGDGCVHTKIDFDHTTDAGRARYRAFVEAAADLTVTLGGSLSGEHGDGQARGELLERMFGATLVDMFRDVVRAFDPDGVLNPGRLIDALPLDEDLRDADLAERRHVATVFPFAEQGGAVGAFDRCVGAGTCRRDDDRATMCPSYRATLDEQHSTRGRARLLGELLRPDSTMQGWDDPALVESLDLCLSCKACQVECPVEVDLATMRAEALHQRHDVDGARRPFTSLLLGNVRDLLGAAAATPALANAVARSAAGRRAWARAGFAPQRVAPRLAPRTFMQSWRRRRGAPMGGAPVVLFVDTFTNSFAPQVAAAAVRTLERHGHAVNVVGDVCCGRPRYAEGMLAEAQRDLDRMVAAVDAVGDDAPVVWLEPSCLSVVRDELPALRAGDEAAGRVAQRSRSLAEHVVAEDWDLGGAARRLAMRETIWHPHCHQRASIGTTADAEVLARLGLGWRDLDAGCCGLAGSFGFVAGDRYDVSVAVAEDRFAPRLRSADPRALVVMDGFSCREQTSHLDLHSGTPWHLAEVIDAAEAR